MPVMADLAIGKKQAAAGVFLNAGRAMRAAAWSRRVPNFVCGLSIFVIAACMH
jgi:hypothetical protein